MRAVCVATAVATIGCSSGCVSSRTWSAIEEVERELAAEGEEDGAAVIRGLAADDRRPIAASSCAELASRIVASYPGLRAPRDRARAALASARAEGALPAPEVMLEVWDFPIGDPQLADREGMYMLSIAQDLPPAGMLDGQARAAAEEAQMALGDLAEARRSVRAEAARACAEWAAAEIESRRLEDAAAAIAAMRDVMQARFAAGGDPLADIARADSELARIERERAAADARRAGAIARLGAMLDAPIDDSSAPDLAEPPAPSAIDALVARAVELRGEVRIARARARAAAARAGAAEAGASVPTFSVRATYMQTPGMRAGLGAQLGMTLPWLWSGEGDVRDAARIEAELELDRVAGIEREIRLEVVRAARELDVAARSLAVLRGRERPAAQRALEAIAASYASGEVDLVAWIDAARMLRELDVEEARMLGEAAQALAELESAIGERLDPIRASEEEHADE